MCDDRPYGSLAAFYDRFSDEDCDYEVWSQYLYEKLADIPDDSGVDLACGTGKMTALLARNFRVIGVDSSREMLNVATRRHPACRFICQKMEDFTLFSPVSFFTCVNDGVNYLPQDKTLAFFRRIYDNLRTGGKFIFDISSTYKLKEILADNVFFIDEEDVTCLWTSKLRKTSVQLDVVVFRKEGETYRRSDEKHVQYLHEEADLLRQLQEVGFETETSAEYGRGKVGKRTQRITFCATKRG